MTWNPVRRLLVTATLVALHVPVRALGLLDEWALLADDDQGGSI